VKGRGAAKAGKPGDLLVTVRVAVPAKLTAEAREALEAYAAAQPEDPRAELMAQVKAHG
jgi:molecular chaperone DnaJ